MAENSRALFGVVPQCHCGKYSMQIFRRLTKLASRCLLKFRASSRAKLTIRSTTWFKFPVQQTGDWSRARSRFHCISICRHDYADTHSMQTRLFGSWTEPKCKRLASGRSWCAPTVQAADVRRLCKRPMCASGRCAPTTWTWCRRSATAPTATRKRSRKDGDATASDSDLESTVTNANGKGKPGSQGRMLVKKHRYLWHFSAYFLAWFWHFYVLFLVKYAKYAKYVKYIAIFEICKICEICKIHSDFWNMQHMQNM